MADGEHEYGNWDVDINSEQSGVRIEFTTMGPDGVEQFVTAMEADNAICFASAVLNMAIELKFPHECTCNRDDDADAG